VVCLSAVRSSRGGVDFVGGEGGGGGGRKSGCKYFRTILTVYGNFSYTLNKC